LYPGNYFEYNWLDYRPLFERNNGSSYTELHVNLDKSFFENLKFDKQSLEAYRISAAINCSKNLGSNPALCISGGIDSQAMLHSFIESGVIFTAYAFVFNDDLNLHDITFARNYCTEHNVKLQEIPFDVISFLTRENYDYGITYKSTSPHFNVHYKFCDILFDKGHTGVCFGGCTPYYSKKYWGHNFNRNAFNYITYSEVTGHNVQGSFLSYSPNLAWSVGLLTPYISIDPDMNGTGNDLRRLQNLRYASKVLGYSRAGLDIRESEKLTGFEKVKEYYRTLTNDGYEFENRFRRPLAQALPQQILPTTKFVFKEGIEELLKGYMFN